MPYERTGYAPWSLTREAGVQSATVDGTIQVPQYIQPTLNTGFVDENGNWKGTKSDDENFIGITKAEQIAAGATVLFPDTGNENHINMAGFRHLQLAIKSSRSDTVGLIGRMGPDTVRFANLSPVAAGAEQNYMGASRYIDNNFDEVLKDTSNSCVADAWVVYTIFDRCAGQLNFVIELTNNAGDPTDFELAYRRLV